MGYLYYRSWQQLSVGSFSPMECWRLNTTALRPLFPPHSARGAPLVLVCLPPQEPVMAPPFHTSASSSVSGLLKPGDGEGMGHVWNRAWFLRGVGERHWGDGCSGVCGCISVQDFSVDELLLSPPTGRSGKLWLSLFISVPACWQKRDFPVTLSSITHMCAHAHVHTCVPTRRSKQYSGPSCWGSG